VELSDFSTWCWPPSPRTPNIVYIIGFEHTGRFVPIYVGESERGIARIGEYITANFKSPTDFNVGEAARYLQQRGYKVQVKFKEVQNPRKEEQRITQKLQELLPNWRKMGYDYQKAKEDEQRRRVHELMSAFLQALN